MISRSKAVWLASAAAVAFASPTFAETPAAPTESGANGQSQGEVVVTAQKREQRLLDVPQSATVRAITEVDYFVIDNAIEVLKSHPDWLLQIARLLAQRVNTTTATLTRDKPEDEMILPQNFLSSWGDPTV
jgi:CRP-like cAMP-binding protein